MERGITDELTKKEWINRYGGRELLDREGMDVVPCGSDCDDSICHGWKVVPRTRMITVPVPAGQIPYTPKWEGGQCSVAGCKWTMVTYIGGGQYWCWMHAINEGLVRR